ncbi:MAG: SseB family protein [Actinobacteria bacterium]|nr:SseB family protein [Actinomycetota bacterium]
MAGLNTGGQRFAGDDGAADPHLAAVLAAYGAGEDSEQAALTALAGARFLVPLVERPADADEPAGAGEAHDDGCDHQAAREMAFPTLIGRDGRPALLAFTSLAALASWRPDARPVPTAAAQVWGTAVADSCAVVIDVAGPVPVAVDGARLAALAAGQSAPAAPDDPDIRADVAAALAELPEAAAVTGAELAPGPDGTDLAVRLRLAPAATQRAVQQVAEAIAARLAVRLRQGIQFSAAPAEVPAPAEAPAPAETPAASSAPQTPAAPPVTPAPSRSRG